MVSKTEQILEDMRACTPPEKIDDSSKSSWYNAYTIWKPEAEAVYTRIINDIRAANSQKSEIHGEIKLGNAELEKTRQAHADEKVEREKTQSTDAALKEHVSELQVRSNAMESRLADLDRRGITEKALEQVLATDITSEAELFARFKTAKDAQELSKGNEQLEAKRIELANGISTEVAKQETAKRETQSEVNRRDEFRRINALYVLLLDLLFDFLKRGYTVEHFKLLLNGLRQLEIVGQPRNSMTRLLNALQKIKTLEELDAAIARTQATFATLLADANGLRGTIDAYMDGAIASMNQVSTTATNKMEALLNQHTASMNTLSKYQQGLLSKLEANAETKLTEINQLAQAQASYMNESMGNMYLTLSTAFKIYHGEVSKWGVMKVETGKFQAELKWGQYIQQLINDPKLAADMSTSLALQMADWLHIWVGKHLPETKSLPPEHLSTQESGLSRYFPVKFTNITEWVRYELRDLQRRGVI
jgi:hypothetical protein